MKIFQQTQRRIVWIIVLWLCVGICNSVQGGEPAEFSDEAVENAIKKSVAFLWGRQRKEGNWDMGRNTHNNPVGVSALAIYSLLEAGAKPHDPRVDKALGWLSKQQTTKTYDLAMCASAFGAAVRKGESKWRKQLEHNVRDLLVNQKDGMYAYDYAERIYGSRSNDHFGALGVWAGAQVNLEIPQRYWKMIYKYWALCQESNGGWRYGQGNGIRPEVKAAPGISGSMTSAGIVTLYVCHDNLNNSSFLRCNGRVLDKRIDAGLKWLGQNLKAIYSGERKEHAYSYTLYAIERAALASGFKYFGEVNWYREGVRHVLPYQLNDGSFKPPGGKQNYIVDTALVLLFLQRGRNPVLFNKLDFEGDWNNRPRDMANFTRWLGKTFETEYSWQIIPISAPVEEWHDAPILYISGSKKVDFSKEQIKKLRTFVNRGGTIFSVAECNGSAFNTSMRRLYAKLFPKYELTELPKDHQIYAFHFKCPPGRPKLFAVNNGARPLAIHVPSDLSKAWQARQYITGRWAFEITGNIVFYITDKGAWLRSRGATPWPTINDISPQKELSVTRVTWSGNSNPEPAALERLAILMNNQRGIQVTPSMEPAENLSSSKTQLAWITGTGILNLTDVQKKAIKQFVDNGGFLVVDAAGGNEKFAKSAKGVLEKIFAQKQLDILPAKSPVYMRKGSEVKNVSYHKAAEKRVGVSHAPRLFAVMRDEKPVVIFSEEDITVGLSSYSGGMIIGYSSDDATRIAMNILSYVAELTSQKKE